MEKKVYLELPPFTGRNVPITEIAAASTKMPSMCALACSRES